MCVSTTMSLRTQYSLFQTLKIFFPVFSPPFEKALSIILNKGRMAFVSTKHQKDDGFGGGGGVRNGGGRRRGWWWFAFGCENNNNNNNNNNNDDDDDDEYEACLAELAKTISGKNRNLPGSVTWEEQFALLQRYVEKLELREFLETRTRYTWLGRKEKGRRARSRKAFCSKTRSKTSVCLQAHTWWTFENGFG